MTTSIVEDWTHYDISVGVAIWSSRSRTAVWQESDDGMFRTITDDGCFAALVEYDKKRKEAEKLARKYRPYKSYYKPKL